MVLLIFFASVEERNCYCQQKRQHSCSVKQTQQDGMLVGLCSKSQIPFKYTEVYVLVFLAGMIVLSTWVKLNRISLCKKKKIKFSSLTKQQAQCFDVMNLFGDLLTCLRTIWALYRKTNWFFRYFYDTLSTVHLLLLLLVFSPWAGLGRDQSSVRRLVWLWYAASCASS